MEHIKTSRNFIDKFLLGDKEDFDSHETGTVTATLPNWMIKRLNEDSKQIGISRSRLMVELIEIAMDDIDHELATTFNISEQGDKK